MLERLCTKRAFALLLAGFAILTALPAHAESCAARAQMVERLQQAYEEDLAGGGLHSDSAVVELWASAETGTFTVISTDTNGLSCIIATGTDWQGIAAITKASSI